MVVAPLDNGTRFGINVGRFREANGMITGVVDGFLGVNVRRDFFLVLELSSSSSSDSFAAFSVVGSASELSITSGVGLMMLLSVVVVDKLLLFELVSMFNDLLSLVTTVESPDITAT